MINKFIHQLISILAVPMSHLYSLKALPDHLKIAAIEYRFKSIY